MSQKGIKLKKWSQVVFYCISVLKFFVFRWINSLKYLNWISRQKKKRFLVDFLERNNSKYYQGPKISPNNKKKHKKTKKIWQLACLNSAVAQKKNKIDQIWIGARFEDHLLLEVLWFPSFTWHETPIAPYPLGTPLGPLEHF